MTDDKTGFRIWELDDKTKVPKVIISGDLKNIHLALDDLDLENKTYAIRIGKKGME